MSDPIHILLVENDPQKVRTIWNMLHEKSHFQYAIEAVTGMKDALIRLEQEDIDVALLDLSLLSFQSETEAVQEILKAHPHLALLVLTELENEQAGLRALEAGAQDYLLKHEIATHALIRALHYAVERQRAETLIHIAEEQRRIATNSIVDYAIITFDEVGQITDWSKGAEQVFGYDKADIIGQPTDVLFTPEDRTAGVPQQELIRTREQGLAEDERWHIRQDGSRFYASGMTRPIYDNKGHIQGFTKIARDVTESHNRQIMEQEQRSLAEGLRDAAVNLNSTLNLKEVLEQALKSAHRIITFRAAVLILADSGKLTDFVSDSLNTRERVVLERWYWRQSDIASTPLYQSAAQTRQPTIIQNGRTKDLRLPAAFGSMLLVSPLTSDDAVLGYLTFINTEPYQFSETDLYKVQAFNYQVVAAIQNARLFVHSQEQAILHERHQIARDLHDAVLQTLFSATIMLQASERQWLVRSEGTPHLLTQINQLIQGAIAEMRGLLIELRPDNIPMTPFKKLLEQLVTALQSRKQIEVNFECEGEPILPANVHIMLYRIAQETLNNTVKHAQATTVSIIVHGGENYIDIRIRDNGRGFSTDVPSSGLGLQIMQERAEEINATIDIQSSPGNGSEIHVTWPAQERHS